MSLLDGSPATPEEAECREEMTEAYKKIADLQATVKRYKAVADALTEWKRPLSVFLDAVPQSVNDEGVFMWSRSSNVESEIVAISVGMVKLLLKALNNLPKEQL